MTDDDSLFQRFPQLSGFDDMDDTQRIKALQTVLNSLQHELDDAK